MGAREFMINKGTALKIDALAGSGLRVRLGEVWVTQLGDIKDYFLTTGQSMVLRSNGPVVATAYKSTTLLDVFRADPAGTREQIEREAKRTQARYVWAWLRKILGQFRRRVI